MRIKDTLLKNPLSLAKTHDFSVSKKPRLTVIMIHGIASDSSTFVSTLKYLEGTRTMYDVRFITFDLLGVGKSYKSDKINYGYTAQIEALDNAIKKLKIETPIVLLGHSMGTLIATKYATEHKRVVKSLILVSPPVYTSEDLENPAFEVAMTGFIEAVSVKNRGLLKDKMFNDSMKYIVRNPGNYERLASLTIPARLIYGKADQIIAPFNIPKVLKENPRLSAVATPARHGLTHDKYGKIIKAIEEALNG